MALIKKFNKIQKTKNKRQKTEDKKQNTKDKGKFGRCFPKLVPTITCSLDTCNGGNSHRNHQSRLLSKKSIVMAIFYFCHHQLGLLHAHWTLAMAEIVILMMMMIHHDDIFTIIFEKND